MTIENFSIVHREKRLSPSLFKSEFYKDPFPPISLQLVDHTTITPKRIVEDVLVWVDKFIFPVDFIVVNIEENKEVPVIIGRSFLATSRTVLNIQKINSCLE